MTRERNWTVLFIGGPSGVGKSCVAGGLARHYGVNVLEIDDIALAIKTLTTKEALPATHYWSGGVDWRTMGVRDNVNWLIGMGSEIAPALRAVAEDHVESGVPIIIEGDFLNPALTASFCIPRVKALFVHEPEEGQIVQNYLAREGGEAQAFRAEISLAYGSWLADECRQWGIPLLASRPWDTAVDRAVACLG